MSDSSTKVILNPSTGSSWRLFISSISAFWELATWCPCWAIFHNDLYKYISNPRTKLARYKQKLSEKKKKEKQQQPFAQERVNVSFRLYASKTGSDNRDSAVFGQSWCAFLCCCEQSRGAPVINDHLNLLLSSHTYYLIHFRLQLSKYRPLFIQFIKRYVFT